MAGHKLVFVGDSTMASRLAGGSSYVAVLLHKTDRFVRPDVDPIIREHGRRNMALATAGVLPVVLPVSDDTDLAGIGVFAASPDDATSIMDDDPGVRAGIFSLEVHPAFGLPGATLP